MAAADRKRNWKGLTRRWVVNVLSVVLLALVLFSVIVAALVKQYYARSVEQYLADQLDAVASVFNGDPAASTAAFEESAREYVETFAMQEQMEVQFLRSDGRVLLSTAGYLADTYEQSTDYENALRSADHTALWQGRSAGDEPVMTAAAIIRSRENSAVCLGAVRIIVSLSGVNRQYSLVLASIFSLVALVFVMIVLSGLYFINSIIVPIQGVGKIARQIARGDFEARITGPRRKDEIGDLCDAINNMAGELASTEQMKNEFISSVSHELRTPLTAIKGWGETVRDATDDPALVQKGMEVIIGEAERLSVIVEDLLDFSRMQNGRLTYHMKPCDVVAEMAEAILTLTDTAKKKQIQLDFTEPDNLPPIVGDAVRLQQVFVNVLGNALKYTPEKGSIVVDMKALKDEIEIYISDTGTGIDPDDLAYIKQKFYKGKDAVRGSGIGLAIADEIVKAHGGRMDVASTLHVGTTVTIALPVRPVHLAGQEELL